MGKIKLQEREEIPVEYTWDLESMYKNEKEWEKDCEKVKNLSEDIFNYKGKILSSSKVLLEVLKKRDELYRIVSKIFSYGNMKLDEDSRKSKSQILYNKGLGLYVYAQEKTSFIVPEILSAEEDELKGLLKEEGLCLYKQYFDDIFRSKKHVLSTEEETLLAQMGEIADSPENIFSMMSNADIKFPVIKDEEGKDVEITHGNFIPLLESKDRNVRKAAFEGLYTTYNKFNNTFAAMLNGNVKKNIFFGKVRKYPSSLSASLGQNNVAVDVYDNLIKSVHNNLKFMYKYIDIRKKALNVDELHMYDLYTPIVKNIDIEIPYEEGKDIVLKGLEPLGSEYRDIVKKGFKDRWIDVYENRGKRSGGYSGGSYDSKPYILLNYKDTLNDVFTLAHEMGHSLHSYFSRENQPFIYGNYSIFVAEVASTCNEALLMNYLLNNTHEKEKKLYLLNHYMEQFRTTLYRQTMFAEFEKIIYEEVEKGGSLTGEYLNKTYKELNEKYYGPGIVVDDLIANEWERIPHFYYNFYVFQYATGFSAAIYLSQMILKEGKSGVDRYLRFLKSGSSDYPINVLKNAGVDMTTEEPVNNALALFGKLVDEIDELI
ncbi:oligoendopeptidase F [Acidilutibacter cellobiosedens]|jgi:oligoendopeptidase F|uniref:Oligopeptidase F n=1 Tax=Acidilutibacter cellobiosedens TaxID=2507161 RepID=A0A410QEH0_9FIRM|nr:oligoendopeptidase F [Acidilutibacter cellobiosedens]QAT62319.1 oligoendopeptidase F [Acidilutibacter cellobiosedens]